MKNRAFSLIEIIVAITIIGILSGFGGLQLRSYIAKTKDVKAVSALNTVRTAIQMYQLENEEDLYPSSTSSYSKEETIKALKKLDSYLDENSKKIIENGEILIGGSKTSENSEIKYGGKVKITFINPETSKVDSFNVWLEPLDGSGSLDCKGQKWIEY